MATGDFTGKKPNVTYDSLLHVESNDPLNAGYQYITDGYGNRSSIEVSTTAARINNVTLNGTTILGSPLSLANGGLGVALIDPNADRLYFWDDSAGSTAFLELGPNLSITGTTIDAIGGGVTDHGLLTGLNDDDHTQYHTDGRASTWLGTKSTTDLTEGTNLYYTSARFNTAFGTKSTTDLAEGTNLYYTNTRADARIAAAAGVTIQNYDTTLSTLASLVTSANKLPYFTGVDTSALTDLTPFARTLLDDADAATMQATLGIGALTSDTFKTISVAGQSDVVATSSTDTLTLVAGTNIVMTTDAGTDTITINAALAAGATLADGDYGDVTASGSGTTITVDNDAITYAKIQNVSATDKLLGRSTAGAGDVEEITCTAFGRSLIDDAASSNARTTLGVVIGTDVQAYDAELAAIAGLISAADKGIQFTGLGTAATYDLTAAGKAILDDADASAQRTTLGLGTLATQSGTFSGTSSGTNTGDQTITLTGAVTGSGTGSFATAYGDVEISSIAGLTSAADKVPYYTGSGTAALADFTSYGRDLVDSVDAAGARTTLGLGTLATQSGTFSGTSSGTNTGDQNLFQTISIAGQSDVVADIATDTLTLVAGSNITLTTNAGTDTITIAASGGGGLSDADYGDITVSGTGTVMTIDNDVVTYAKMQDVSATDKVLGRSTAGAGDVEEITLTAFGRSLIDDVDASAARTTLGSVIGTNVQAYDATLAALAAYNTNGSLHQTAADTFVGRTLTGTAAELTVTNGDGVSGNPTISLPSALTFTGKTVTGGTFTTPTININDNVLSIRDDGDTSKIMQFQLSGITASTTRTLTVPDASGTIALTSNLSSYQPLDTELTAIAGLTSAADQMPYFTGSGTAALTTVSSYARSFLDDANEATLKATLNLEANTDYYAPGGTDVPLADGGTGASLADPGSDKILFWDDSANSMAWLTVDVANGTAIIGTDLYNSGRFFNDIIVSGQSTIEAAAGGGALTIVAGTGIVLTTNSATDTLTITSSSSDNLGLTTVIAQGIFSN